MALATLSIDLEAKLAGLQTGLDKAARLAEIRTAQIQSSFDKLKGIGSSLAGVLGGAFAVGQITQFVRNTVDAVDALNDAADATGSTIEALSGLEQVALRNGGTLDDVTGILVKFNGALKEADGKNGVSQALKAIGLDAAELRKLDPSEALQRTAEALAGFADDGNKARLVQELFGKSIKEAAPLLKDLAEAGKLNATVTKEQAEEAEKFNKNLALISTNATNAGRSLVGQMLPALNEVFVRFQSLEQAFGSKGAGFLAAFTNRDQFTDAGKGVEFYSGKVKELAAQLEKAKANGTGVGFIDRQNVAAAAKELETAQKFLSFYQRVRNVTEADSLPQASYSNEGRNAVRTVGDRPENTTSKDKPRSFEDYQARTSEAVASAISGSAIVKARELADQIAALDKLFFETGLDAEIYQSALDKLTGTTRNVGDATGGFAEEQKWLADLIKDTPTGKLEALRSEMLRLEAAFRSGSITAEQFSEIAQTRLGTLPEEVKPAIDEMTEMTKEFQRNVQDILGDGVESILKGDFDSIGKSFGDMLRKMAAQAIAADIGNLIMGKMGAGGVRGGGLFTSLLSLFGFAKGGVFSGGVQAFASGGIVGSPSLFGMAGGKMGLMGEAGPEAIMPLKRGRDGKLGVAGGGGAVTNIYNVAAGVTRNELVSALQVMAQTITGQTDAKLRRAGVQ